MPVVGQFQADDRFCFQVSNNKKLDDSGRWNRLLMILFQAGKNSTNWRLYWKKVKGQRVVE